MKKIKRIEELDGAQRVSHYTLDDNDEVVIPDGLKQCQVEEWERVVATLKSLELDHVIDGVRLADYCRCQHEENHDLEAEAVEELPSEESAPE